MTGILGSGVWIVDFGGVGGGQMRCMNKMFGSEAIERMSVRGGKEQGAIKSSNGAFKTV